MNKKLILELNNYVEYRKEPNVPIQHILSNDLFMFIKYCNEYDYRLLKELCNYIKNNIPIKYWGSKEKYNKHIWNKQTI